ncbi:hypothetical protein GCM10020000_18120 [Streptomyces olivoverticillatus]
MGWFPHFCGNMAVGGDGHGGAGWRRRRVRTESATTPKGSSCPPTTTSPPPNRPGETLRARLDASRTGRAGLFFARLLGRRPVEDAWRRKLAAEQLVGAALDGLAAAGWEVVHSIELPGDAVISHLLIGPGGVFCVLAEQTRRAAVRLDETDVRVTGDARPYPYVRKARQNAARCSLVLTRGCGYPVRARPVLVLVGGHGSGRARRAGRRQRAEGGAAARAGHAGRDPASGPGGPDPHGGAQPEGLAGGVSGTFLM